MATQTFYRKANVTSAEATTSLFKRFPNAELVSFEKKAANAEEAAAAGAQKGEIVYVATVRVAEFPPSDDSGSDDSSDDSGDAPEPKKEKSDDDSSSDSKGDDDSGDSSDSAPSFGSDADGAEGDGKAPKKLSPDEEMVHLLHQILEALKGGAGPGLGGPDAGPGGPAGLDLPDIGAPGQGEGLPPHGGPAGPPAKAPLPPPIKEKSPIGGGAFAKHIAGRETFAFVRQDVKADGLGHRALIREAMELAPGYRVARLNVNEADDTALVTMERI